MQIFQEIIVITKCDSAEESDFVTPSIKIDDKIHTYMKNVIPYIKKKLPQLSLLSCEFNELNSNLISQTAGDLDVISLE